MKTLVIEDDFTSRTLLQSFLTRFGECHTAVSAGEGLHAFQQASKSTSPYNLLCVDIVMPEVDGQETVRRIRAYEEQLGILPHRGVKIFMTTGLTETKVIFESFRSLCDAYLVKPIDLGLLLDHLRKHDLIEEKAA